MNRWKRPLSLLLMCILLLAACSAPEQEEEENEGKLIYAALNKVSPWLKDNIKSYNNTHPDAQIEVRDYSDEAGPKRLMTELMLGDVPDIIEMQRMGYYKTAQPPPDMACSFHPFFTEPLWRATPFTADTSDQFYMPYRALVQKGYLEDLWPYIDNDSRFGRERIMEAPLKAAEIGGGLYMIPHSVSINTLVGARKVVGDRCGWTLQDLTEAFATMPEDSTVLEYGTTQNAVFFNLLGPQLDQFIDWETGECSFDSQGFRDMLEFLDLFPSQFHTWLSDTDLNWERTDRLHDGMQLLRPMFILTPLNVLAMDNVFGQDTTFIGPPTADGSAGSSFIFHGPILAMSSTCRNKEAAWDFICRQLRAESKSISWWVDSVQNSWASIPLDRIAYRLSVMAGMYIKLGSAGKPTEEHQQRFEELFESTTQLYWPDDTMADAVWDAIGPYLAGDKSMDDTIALVQSRVKLYVNEQR